MDTNRLQQFRTVVETGNLRKASRLLGISHSGLSKAMKTLEAELGFRLLRPSGRGIVVTDEGRALYRRSGGFLAELERLLGAPAPVPGAARVRIGSFEVFTSYFIGELARDFLAGTHFEVHELTPGRLEEALLLDRVDVGITYEPIPRPGIEYVGVTRLTMGAYARAGAFAGAAADALPFVVPATPLEGAPSGVRGRDGWPDERRPRQIRYRVDLMTTGLELVRQGLCGIFIPRFVAHLHNQAVRPELRLERRALPRGMAEVRREVFIVTRESTPETREIRRIAQALRRICSQGA
jgi:DNA-binding transcriptional LysR family regulator